VQPGHAPDQDPKEIIKDAITTGYRYIDCAQFYGNEAMVGTALAECGVARSELYIVSKVRRGACSTASNRTSRSVMQCVRAKGDRRRRDLFCAWARAILLAKGQAVRHQESFANSVCARVHTHTHTEDFGRAAGVG